MNPIYFLHLTVRVLILVQNGFRVDLTTPCFWAELKLSVEYFLDIYEFVVDETNGISLLFDTCLCKVLIYAKRIYIEKW